MNNERAPEGRPARRPLDFTLAPVQGFVGQARRTNDFWAGSYIISFLTAHAMAAVARREGDDSITFPSIAADPLFLAVSGKRLPTGPKDPGARVASLPNRFRAQCRDPVAAGEAATKAVEDAWRTLAEGVWAQAVRPRLLNMPESLQRLLYPGPAAEPLGDSLPSSWERQIYNLWEVYWVADSHGAEVDQRKNRRHLHLYEEQGEVCTVCGIRTVAFGDHLNRSETRRLWHDTGGIADQINGHFGEHTLDKDDRERLCSVCLVKRMWPFVSKNITGWSVRRNIKATYQLCPAGTEGGDSPLPYYAVLVMDGDGLGKLLQTSKDDPGVRSAISASLARFSQAVPHIVEDEHDGVAVYAGGDDVLALVPAANALACARSLRSKFQESTKEAGLQHPMTISGAILFSHMKSPMQAAFAQAQRVLDDVAKDAMGRDAFVVQVEKRSGTPLRFAKRWDGSGSVDVDVGSVGNADPAQAMDWIERTEALAATLLGDEPEQSSGYLYRAAAHLELAKASVDAAAWRDTLLPILTAEYLRGPGRLLNVSWAEAEKRTVALLELTRWQPGPEGVKSEPFQPDALPILRFLAEARKAGAP